jgi:formylglycine-generating enzyme required for sulfatase activity
MFRYYSTALVVAATVLTVSAAHADVFNMPPGQTSLQFVTVGDPGNTADGNGYGAVGYVYQMGEYDVTVGQYVQFLNAVAQTDTYGLYNTYMAVGSYAGYHLTTIGIAQSGSPGSYTYSVAGSDSQAANVPIFDVTWGDAARFCNWLQNGQPTGPEGTGTTETGAYTLAGDTTNLTTETRNSGAAYFLPSDNEWYKAALYKGGSQNAGYWTYETRSDATPSNTLSATGTDNANYFSGAYSDPTNYLTPVGAFAASPGPYGTYDMGGDVWQWTESRGLRGGSWYDPFTHMASGGSWGLSPTGWGSQFGFRVAASARLAGDANGDGRVDVNDLTIVLTNFGSTGRSWSQGCMDGDPTGTVDVNDLTIVLSNFGTTYTAGALGAVPEPASVLLVAAGLASVLAYAWRKTEVNRRECPCWTDGGSDASHAAVRH